MKHDSSDTLPIALDGNGINGLEGMGGVCSFHPCARLSAGPKVSAGQGAGDTAGEAPAPQQTPFRR